MVRRQVIVVCLHSDGGLDDREVGVAILSCGEENERG